ncbi:MAG TPA: TonB-dependent siderophore receptor [Pyrinomonadaceae bacterium]|nr:TonB-dependent siderophore receptor [Pyrinomonadaceae bacterium]
MLLPKPARLAVTFSSIILLVFSVTAQAPQRVLRGRVFDQNRAAIPGASVSVRGPRIRPLAITTSQLGEYSFTLPPGEYQLTASADGFADLSQVVKLADASTEQDLVLQVFASGAFVTITDTAGYAVPAITSATRAPTLLRDIPQSVSVVTQEQIRDQSMVSVADVVAYVPGITSHQGENNRDQLVIRGNSTSADFFLNGVRDDTQYYRDLYNVDRVEALKGPNSMTFGRGGGGGVINRVTKGAGFSPIKEFSAQGGSYGNKRFTADYGQPLNNRFAFRMNGLYENSDSFRHYVGLERYGVNPTATFAVTGRTVVALSYEHFYDRRTADRGIPSFQGRPSDTSISTFFGDPNRSRVRAGVNLASASIDHQVGQFNIRNRTMFGDYDRYYQNYVPGAVTSDKAKVAISAYNNATRRRNLFNQTDVTTSADTGSVKHVLLAGTEVGNQRSHNLRNTGFFNNTSVSILAPFDNPTIDTPITFRQNVTDANNQVKTKLAAGYIQDQVAFSKYLQVIGGLRFDYFDLNFQNNRNGEQLRRIDRLVSPRAGVIVKPAAPISIYANYGVAYLPSSGDQFSSLTTITQQMKPERFSNYELGAKWDLRPQLSLTTAVYRQDRTNTRSTDPNDPTRIVQTGSQRTNGFEFGLNGKVTEAWTVAGGYAYQDAFISSATISARKDAQVALVPHHTFSLWNNYRVMSRLAVGFGLIQRSDMFASVDNTVVLPGYLRADAAIFYSISERWRVQANMQNIFNRKYYLTADGNNNISPGVPASGRVALVARF